MEFEDEAGEFTENFLRRDRKRTMALMRRMLPNHHTCATESYILATFMLIERTMTSWPVGRLRPASPSGICITGGGRVAP